MALQLTKPVVLIGPMATGKSVVGKALAKRHRLKFVDSDQVIVARHGSIADIFAAHGEEYFRTVEAEAIAGIIAQEGPGVLISVGGGAVLSEATRDLLAGCTVVYLSVDLATVYPRISKPTGRPLLAGDPGERWQQLMDERRPVYESIAELQIDTRRKGIMRVVEEISYYLRKGRKL